MTIKLIVKLYGTELFPHKGPQLNSTERVQLYIIIQSHWYQIHGDEIHVIWELSSTNLHLQYITRHMNRFVLIKSRPKAMLCARYMSIDKEKKLIDINTV